ncbi:Malate Na(+) symporter [Streptococcus oralis]|uniref:Malate Na(+) symporter n=2 Tax=Streptococcus oralis TaxID=1303 RepID=A0A139P9F5_STROR|nr:Malate Na(+) symporter [Streptococcus oralis]
MGAGILPLSKIYAANLHGDQTAIFSQLAPATTLGNILAIIGAVMIAKVFANSKYNGHGVLIPINKEELKKEKLTLNPSEIGVGMIFAFTIFLLGVICNAFIPKIHSYAFMIIIVFILKVLNAVPKALENCVVMFNQVIMTNLTHAVLAGIGLSLIDLSTLAQAMTWQFILLSLASVVSMGLASAVIGKMVGLYPVETAIGSGMINNSMGGTGNIAVLSASDRMEMIAFAQMANRLSGAIILILGGLLASMLQ